LKILQIFFRVNQEFIIFTDQIMIIQGNNDTKFHFVYLIMMNNSLISNFSI